MGGSGAPARYPAIPLEGGGTARLGISALSAPVNSGVVIYCLTENWTQSSGTRTGEPLGPFSTEVIHDGVQGIQLKVAKSAMLEAPALALYRLAIPLAEAINAQVLISGPDGQLVARADIGGVDEPFHPWMTFAPDSSGQEESLKVTGQEVEAAGRLETREGRAAIPRFEGTYPLPLRQALDEMADQKLPPLFPEAPVPGFKVTAQGADLFLKVEHELVFGRPDLHFLVRWWVNGKAFHPSLAGEIADQYAYALESYARRAVLRLRFHPEHIGAKPGDKVELQLLYCFHEWQLVNHQLETLAVAAPMYSESPELLLSQRLELPWEGSSAK